VKRRRAAVPRGFGAAVPRGFGAAVPLGLKTLAGPGIVLALLVLGAPCFAGPVDDLLTTGKRAFADGQYSLATESFQRIAREFPESPSAIEAQYMLGVCAFYSGKWSDSATALQRLRLQSPGSLYAKRALYWLAASSMKLGKGQQTLDLLKSYSPGSTGDPYKFPSLLLAGIAQEATGRDAEAAVSYRAILAEGSASALFPEASFRLAGVEYRAGRFNSARDLYGRVLLEGARSAFVKDSVFFLGECELALGNVSEAEKRYRTLTSLYPDSSYREAAVFRLADTAWRQKNAERALDQLDALQREFPNGDYRGDAWRLRGDILLDQKQYERAIAEYRRALGVLKDEGEKQAASYGMGLAQLSLGKKSDAAASFLLAGQGTANAVGEKASYQSALIVAGAGNDADAIHSLEAFLEKFPDSPDQEAASRLLASLLDKTGNSQGAYLKWDSLVSGFPQSAALAEYLFRRGSAALASNRNTVALDDFQRVAKEFPRTTWQRESAYAIGYLYAQRGEYPRALPYFQSVSKDPSGGDVAERGRLSEGICLFNMGSYDEAYASLQKLRASKPRSVSEGAIILYMGRALYRMEKLEEAAARLGEAASLLASDRSTDASDAAEATYWLGWAQLRLGKLPEARDSFTATATRYSESPRRGESLLRAAICDTMQTDDRAAVALFDQLLSTPPSAADAETREQALFEKGRALSRMGNDGQSRDAFEQLAREFPRGRLAPQAWFKVAEKALEDKQYGAAQAGFERVARDFPASELSVQALYWSAEASRQSGDAAAALEGFWKCLAAKPQMALLTAAIDGYDLALQSTGSLEQARLYSQKARATRGLAAEAGADIQLEYARLLMASSPADALAVISDVRRGAPPEPLAGEASLALGTYYAAVGDWTKALDVFSALEGSRADKVGAQAAREHARALEATGHTSEAVDQFLKVAYLYSDYPDLAAAGLYDAARVSRARGDKDRAAKIEQSLRQNYPQSPWAGKVKEN
jgi:TolA-binding protein